MKAITKAVFPVAGLGTRFLPATKAIPKEMLPVIDKPLIQYAAEEAVEAGINVLIFITGRNKFSISDHFDKAYELEAKLEAKENQLMLDLVRKILPSHVQCIYIRQVDTLGLGHAVLCAKSIIGNDPFAVLLADDLIKTDKPACLSQMITLYQQYRSSVIGVERIPYENTNQYGIVESTPVIERLSGIKSIIEKPAIHEAPSNLAVVGRYILSPAIFEFLERIGQGAGGEIQLTDAISKLLGKESVFAYEFIGKRFDCGSKSGYLQATVEYALQHPELKQDFAAYLQGKLEEQK